MRKKNFWINNREPFYYIIPTLIYFAIFLFFPIVFSLALGFYDFHGYSQNIFAKFVGLENFKYVLSDTYFHIALKNTIYFVVGSIVVQLFTALFLAVVIFYGNFKYSTVIRTVIFFPAVLAPVTVSLVWKKLFESDGLINQILRIDFAWLSNVKIAIFVLIFVSIWQWFGYNLVIFFAGLQSLDGEVIEAAEVDGASWIGKITRVVIPMLVPYIVISVILNLIGSFRIFDIVYVMTKGGPIHYTEVLTTLLFFYAFNPQGLSNMGYASVIAMVLLVVMIIFGVIRIRLMTKR